MWSREGGVAVLCRIIREGLAEKAVFVVRPERVQGLIQLCERAFKTGMVSIRGLRPRRPACNSEERRTKEIKEQEARDLEFCKAGNHCGFKQRSCFI